MQNPRIQKGMKVLNKSFDMRHCLQEQNIQKLSHMSRNFVALIYHTSVNNDKKQGRTQRGAAGAVAPPPREDQTCNFYFTLDI